MSNKKIRKWMHDHGIEYVASDWGARNDVGESDVEQHEDGERYYGRDGTQQRVRRYFALGGGLGTFFTRDLSPMWGERDDPERRFVEALEDFFDPYMVRLPKRQEDLLRSVFGDLKTYDELGAERKTSRQAAHRAVGRALAALAREFEKDGLDMETALDEYWKRKFGVPYPGLILG